VRGQARSACMGCNTHVMSKRNEAPKRSVQAANTAIPERFTSPRDLRGPPHADRQRRARRQTATCRVCVKTTLTRGVDLRDARAASRPDFGAPARSRLATRSGPRTHRPAARPRVVPSPAASDLRAQRARWRARRVRRNVSAPRTSGRAGVNVNRASRRRTRHSRRAPRGAGDGPSLDGCELSRPDRIAAIPTKRSAVKGGAVWLGSFATSLPLASMLAHAQRGPCVQGPPRAAGRVRSGAPRVPR